MSDLQSNGRESANQGSGDSKSQLNGASAENQSQYIDYEPIPLVLIADDELDAGLITKLHLETTTTRSDLKVLSNSLTTFMVQLMALEMSNPGQSFLILLDIDLSKANDYMSLINSDAGVLPENRKRGGFTIFREIIRLTKNAKIAFVTSFYDLPIPEDIMMHKGNRFVGVLPKSKQDDFYPGFMEMFFKGENFFYMPEV